MRFLGYLVLMLILLAGPVLVIGSLMIEHVWVRWVVIVFAVAFPLALIGDIIRETPGQRITRLKRAIRRRDASREAAS